MKKVILVADDSPTIRKFVAVALSVKGFEIISCSDGMEAIEILPNQKVDLVITDLAVFAVDKTVERLKLLELANGVTMDEVRAKTEAEFS